MAEATIKEAQTIKAEMYAQKKWWRGGREIAAFEEGREFLGQDPK